MNILITYASKSGITETCAHILEQDFNGHAELVDLTQTVPSLDAYDTVLIGGPIRYGQLHASVKKFMRNHLEELSKKEVGLFICCANAESAEEYFQNNFPKELLEHATAIECFGGEIRTDTLGFFEKLVAKMALKSYPANQQPHIIKDNIHIFADRVVEN